MLKRIGENVNRQFRQIVYGCFFPCNFIFKKLSPYKLVSDAFKSNISWMFYVSLKLSCLNEHSVLWNILLDSNL